METRTSGNGLPDILLTCGFCSALFGMSLLVSRRTHAHRELAGRARQAEAERARSAAEAVAVERTRIAREMHDVVAHSLTVAVVQCGAAGDDLDSGVAAIDPVRTSGPHRRGRPVAAVPHHHPQADRAIHPGQPRPRRPGPSNPGNWRADTPRTPGTPAHRRRPVQRRDRGPPVPVRGNGQDAREPPAGQARAQGPGPSRRPRLRNQPDHARLKTRQTSLTPNRLTRRDKYP